METPAPSHVEPFAVQTRVSLDDSASRLRRLLLVGGLAAAPAMAQEAPEPSRLMRPGHLDLRLEGGLGFLPPAGEAGASTELGVVTIGPGTLSAGAQLGFRQCLLACSVSSVLAQQRVSNLDLYALGRLGYHFSLEGKNQDRVDLYGVLLGGVMEARTTRSAPEFRYEGRGRGPAVGVGVGGSYFLSSRFFVGAEARLRFATGSYALTLTRGTYTFTPDDSHWVRLGPSTVLFAGARLF
ncbi:hypothetical protein [Archangium sp.]|uniref:hypothetical protein n=1 Tax=Archangium sp. TaxID=1872627 RepID=UPI00389A5CBA